MISYVQGDLISMAKSGQYSIIAHGCNAFHAFGAGVALAIKKAFPKAYEADLGTVKGNRAKLGTYSSAQCGSVLVLNAYTQFYWGNKFGVPVDYDAISRVFERINQDFSGKVIAIPKIGAGLAGGDWGRIEKILEEKCADIDLHVVCLPA